MCLWNRFRRRQDIDAGSKREEISISISRTIYVTIEGADKPSLRADEISRIIEVAGRDEADAVRLFGDQK